MDGDVVKVTAKKLTAEMLNVLGLAYWECQSVRHGDQGKVDLAFLQGDSFWLYEVVVLGDNDSLQITAKELEGWQLVDNNITSLYVFKRKLEEWDDMYDIFVRSKYLMYWRLDTATVNRLVCAKITPTRLLTMSEEEIDSIPGIGDVRIKKIVAAIETARITVRASVLEERKKAAEERIAD